MMEGSTLTRVSGGDLRRRDDKEEGGHGEERRQGESRGKEERG